MKDKVLVITGPTAAGKSDIAYHFAKENNAEIISCDSMQIYKYMDIGTAKPPISYLGSVKHHMIDIVFPTQEYSAGEFKKECLFIIDDILKRNKLPIMTGGTGLYMNSVIFDLQLADAGDKNTALAYEDYYNKHGRDALYSLLKSKDESAALRIHPNNIKRVIRALQIASSDIRKEYTSAFSLSYSKTYDFKIVAITKSRERLYEDINKRVDMMIENGLVTEVKSLLKQNLLTSKTSLQAIGYKEIISYINNEVSLDTAVGNIKQATRRYAKRQLTWLKKIPGINWIDADNYTPEILHDLLCE